MAVLAVVALGGMSGHRLVVLDSPVKGTTEALAQQSTKAAAVVALALLAPLRCH